MKENKGIISWLFVAAFACLVMLSHEGSKASAKVNIRSFDREFELYPIDSTFIWEDNLDTSWTYYGSTYYGNKQNFK